MPCSNQKRIQFLSPHRESERRERIRYYTREGGSSVYGATEGEDKSNAYEMRGDSFAMELS